MTCKRKHSRNSYRVVCAVTRLGHVCGVLHVAQTCWQCLVWM